MQISTLQLPEFSQIRPDLDKSIQLKDKFISKSENNSGLNGLGQSS